MEDPRLRKIDPQEKIQAVITTARRLFVEHGYHSVSIPMIVKESRVSTGAIYHHFDNKEQLARRIYDQTLSEFQEMLEQRLAGQGDVLSRLSAFGKLLVDVAQSDPEMMRYMLFLNHGEFLSSCPPICSSTPFRWVQETIRNGIADGILRSEHPFVAAASFIGAILRTIELSYQGVITESLDTLISPILDHALRSIRA